MSFRPAALCFVLAVGCVADVGDAPTPNVQIDIETPNGKSLNGTSLNGKSLNGIALNGISLNGKSLNGVSLNGSQLVGRKVISTLIWPWPVQVSQRPPGMLKEKWPEV